MSLFMDRGKAEATTRRLVPLMKRAVAGAVVLALGLSGWHVIRSGFLSEQQAGTTGISLTATEVTALRKLLKPAPLPSTGGTKVAISQVRGLEERLQEIEKTSSDELSPAASSDTKDNAARSGRFEKPGSLSCPSRKRSDD
jgi:hypothetical protein